MKLDLLAFGAHPDDVELSCSGTIISHQLKGWKVGVVDLTRGELGTRGSEEIRANEASEASRIMGLSVRENLEMPDGWFTDEKVCQLAVIRVIRHYKPEIVLANAPFDRHPDHGRAAGLVKEAFFKSGLSRIETRDRHGVLQTPWRPKKIYHYIQSVTLEADFFVDISAVIERKILAIKAYKSQFFDPNSTEPNTYISSPQFMKMLEARQTEWGHRIGTIAAEGFISSYPLGVNSLDSLI